MDTRDTENLLQLIRNEIDLGFTFLNTAQLSARSQHLEHATQARLNAQVACNSAVRFLKLLSPLQAQQFGPRLEELKRAVGPTPK